GPEPQGLSGLAPTATLPAQTPVAISLGQVESAGAAPGANGGGSSGGTYVVQSGDNLGSIAAAMNVPPEAQADWISQVLELNGMADARLLQAGQELVLPGVTGGSPASTPVQGQGTPTPSRTPASSGGQGTYIVVSGDTPFGIAEKFCVQGAAA